MDSKINAKGPSGEIGPFVKEGVGMIQGISPPFIGRAIAASRDMKLRNALSVTMLLHITTVLSADPRQNRAATNLEMRNIAEAEEFCYLDHSQFTTLENLDDTFATPGNPPYQGFNDNGGAIMITPSTGIPQRHVVSYDSFFAGPPYLTISSGHQYEGPSEDYDEGTPLDLWGNPYYFYSPLGLIEPKTVSVSLRYYGDSFVYYTIVSHGPDGVQSADDVFYQLPYTITSTTISSARLRSSPGRATTYTLVIRGFQLGGIQGAGDVLFNGASAGGTVTQWTAGAVSVNLTSIPAPGTLVSIRTNSGVVTRTVPLLSELGTSSAQGWPLYQ